MNTRITDSWLCPQHGDHSSLAACVENGCVHARLAAASPDMRAVLACIVEAHDNGDVLDGFIRIARELVARASVEPPR